MRTADTKARMLDISMELRLERDGGEVRNARRTQTSALSSVERQGGVRQQNLPTTGPTGSELTSQSD